MSNKLYGLYFRPCSETEEENEQKMRTSPYFLDAGFRLAYEKNLSINQIIAESAKIYIHKYYKEVSDWSNLHVTLKKNIKGNEVQYYKHRPGRYQGKFLERLEKASEERHNPATSLTDVILDPTDGDLSLTINGTEHWWIDDESVIIIADYIERMLHPERNDSC